MKPRPRAPRAPRAKMERKEVPGMGFCRFSWEKYEITMISP